MRVNGSTAKTGLALAAAAGLLGACATRGDAPTPPVAVSDAPAVEDGRPRWWSTPGQTAQYGVPDTDDRLLRVDCDDGRLWIGGPSVDGGQEGDPTQVALAGQLRDGELGEAGDGINFFVPVERDDPALAVLLAGQPLEVAQGGGAWSVPGEGAPGVLVPLVKACR